LSDVDHAEPDLLVDGDRPASLRRDVEVQFVVVAVAGVGDDVRE